MSLNDPKYHGWLPDLTIDWIDEPYPEDVSQLLLTDNSSDGDDSDFECDENADSLSSDDDNGQLRITLVIMTYKYEFKEQILLIIVRAFHID